MSKEKIMAEIALLKHRLQSITDETVWCIARLDELNMQIHEIFEGENRAMDVIPESRSAFEIVEETIEVKPEILEQKKDIPPVQVIETVQGDKVQNLPTPAPKPKEAKSNLNDRLAHKKEKTPVEQFADQPIADLKKAFTLNQKLAFIKHLFNNDATQYNTVLEQINGAANMDAAVLLMFEYITSTDDEVFEEFHAFVKRRFL